MALDISKFVHNNNTYMISQILKSKLHKQCIIIKFLRDSIPKGLLDSAEVINTESFKVNKIGDNTYGEINF